MRPPSFFVLVALVGVALVGAPTSVPIPVPLTSGEGTSSAPIAPLCGNPTGDLGDLGVRILDTAGVAEETSSAPSMPHCVDADGVPEDCIPVAGTDGILDLGG